MDPAAYNNFLKERLQEALNPLEKGILNLVSHDNDSSKLYRQVGCRDMLVELLAKLDPLLNEFFKSAE